MSLSQAISFSYDTPRTASQLLTLVKKDIKNLVEYVRPVRGVPTEYTIQITEYINNKLREEEQFLRQQEKSDKEIRYALVKMRSKYRIRYVCVEKTQDIPNTIVISVADKDDNTECHSELVNLVNTKITKPIISVLRSKYSRYLYKYLTIELADSHSTEIRISCNSDTLTESYLSEDKFMNMQLILLETIDLLIEDLDSANEQNTLNESVGSKISNTIRVIIDAIKRLISTIKRAISAAATNAKFKQLKDQFENSSNHLFYIKVNENFLSQYDLSDLIDNIYLPVYNAITTGDLDREDLYEEASNYNDKFFVDSPDDKNVFVASHINTAIDHATVYLKEINRAISLMEKAISKFETMRVNGKFDHSDSYCKIILSTVKYDLRFLNSLACMQIVAMSGTKDDNLDVARADARTKQEIIKDVEHKNNK